jgi:WD40 repeat protein
VAIGDGLGVVNVFNSSRLSLTQTFQAHSGGINKIKQSPFNNYSNSTSNYVATCSTDYTVKIWDISTSSNWTLFTTYANHTDIVYGME